MLYYGDNLDILKRYIADESIDLIYLDPPFKSEQDYNVLFAEQNGRKSTSQIKVFEDTWHWGLEAEEAYHEAVIRGGKLSEVMQAFRSFLGENDMMAYLAMMAPRLQELHRVLKPSGSIYLHCDTTASHYLKMLMDAIFKPENFLNEIVWRRYKRPKGSQHAARKYGTSTDILLFYSKSGQHKFYPDRVDVKLDAEDFDKRYTHKDDKGPYYSGPLLRSPSMGPRPNLVYEYKGFTPGPEGWRMTKEKLIELDKKGDLFWTESGIPRRKVRPQGIPVMHIDNLWTDIEAIGSQARERLGYPTQKPEALLERIIQASSDEGDIVLDPFCGCGTTIAVSQKLNRRWIGIDITHLAVSLIKYRLTDTFGEEIMQDIEVIGEPISLSGAKQLAEEDPFQFQWWALGLVKARPVEQKKGADKGIDGKLYFFERPDDKTPKQIIFSVKSGENITVKDIRDLRGVIEREKAPIGVFITLHNPTKPMIAEAAKAGFYVPKTLTAKKYSKIQILTIKELLNGKTFDAPPFIRTEKGNATFRKAPKAKKKKKTSQTQRQL